MVHGRQRELEYHIAKELLQSTCYPSAPLSLSGLLVAGAASGALIWLVLKPIELVKCQMAGATGPTADATRADGPAGHHPMGALVRETGGSTA
ncbi:MAG: hypothetical protein M1826_002836 [Phylliscum demangeonii]|nr:MAG: hypothetical protein M1826_002836 [Phylliscum demangeonii]